METVNLSNVEDLLNILANAAQIIGLASAVPVLFACWIPRACGLHGYSLKILALGILLLGLGLATPGVVNELLRFGESNTQTGTIMAIAAGGLSALCVLVLSTLSYFLPAMIAMRQGKKQKVSICVWNIFCFIAIAWLAVFTWACMRDKPPGVTEI